MAIAMRHFKKSSQEESGYGTRLAGRPHGVIIISANLSVQSSMSPSDGAMAQSRDALCHGICVDLRYLRLLRATVRWLSHVKTFAVVFAIIAFFAVKQRCVFMVGGGPG